MCSLSRAQGMKWFYIGNVAHPMHLKIPDGTDFVETEVVFKLEGEHTVTSWYLTRFMTERDMEDCIFA
jgi:hypothetical protein